MIYLMTKQLKFPVKSSSWSQPRNLGELELLGSETG